MRTALNLCTLIEKYNDDEKCRETIKHLRWPAGVTCLRCQSDNVGPVSDRKVFVCYSCRYQFSATVGTIFHDSHLPLTTWFFVSYLMTESRKGISANQIKRMLGISYKTAWYLCHRIRAAMVEADPEKLDGTVEVDETYVGGKPRRGVGRKRGRGTPKEIVIGIRKRSGDLRFFHADDVRSGTLATFIRDNVSEDVDVVMTDDFTAYPKAIAKAGVLAEHQAINHSKGVYVIGDLHTNTVESAFSLLKRGIMGTWHKISAKHLPAYLDEMTFRFNNRDNRFLFRDTLLKLIQSENLEYKQLIAA
jgi:transposase-like protein